MKVKKNFIYQMVATALLIALKIILERLLSYSVWNVRIGFSFLAVVFAASFLGAPSAMIVAGVGDFLGAIIFPTGQYFPGFTLTAVLTALCTALFIHRNASFIKITLSVIINQIFGSVLLNSLWISILYGANYFTLIPTRLIQAAVMSVIQISLTALFFGNKSRIRILLMKQIPQV